MNFSSFSRNVTLSQDSSQSVSRISFGITICHLVHMFQVPQSLIVWCSHTVLSSIFLS